MDKLLLEKAESLLKKEFGRDWLTIAQLLGTENLRKRLGKELTSFTAYPERGSGGDNQWNGNCSPEIVADVLGYVLDCKKYGKKNTDGFVLLDPMSGSGTSQAAADRYKVRAILYDLNPAPVFGTGGWNALRDDIEDDADMVFFHPPYHNMVCYSGAAWGGQPHPDDLSRCVNYGDYIEKLNYVIKKLYFALRKDGRLVILVGDYRKNGEFHSIQRDMMTVGTQEAFITKAQFNCRSDNRTYSVPFIPIVTEYLAIFKKEGGLVVPFSRRLSGVFNMLKSDNAAVTWKHLIRSVMETKGGEVSSEELYETLADHPKAQSNAHYKDRIRAVIQEYPQDFQPCGRGRYQLAYKVA